MFLRRNAELQPEFLAGMETWEGGDSLATLLAHAVPEGGGAALKSLEERGWGPTRRQNGESSGTSSTKGQPGDETGELSSATGARRCGATWLLEKQPSSWPSGRGSRVKEPLPK